MKAELRENINNMSETSSFQKAIETIEKLSLEEQEILIQTVQKRLSQERRKIISQEIKEVRKEVAQGQVKIGSVDQFLEELDQS